MLNTTKIVTKFIKICLHKLTRRFCVKFLFVFSFLKEICSKLRKISIKFFNKKLFQILRKIKQSRKLSDKKFVCIFFLICSFEANSVSLKPCKKKHFDLLI